MRPINIVAVSLDSTALPRDSAARFSDSGARSRDSAARSIDSAMLPRDSVTPSIDSAALSGDRIILHRVIRTHFGGAGVKIFGLISLVWINRGPRRAEGMVV